MPGGSFCMQVERRKSRRAGDASGRPAGSRRRRPHAEFAVAAMAEKQRERKLHWLYSAACRAARRGRNSARARTARPTEAWSRPCARQVRPCATLMPQKSCARLVAYPEGRLAGFCEDRSRVGSRLSSTLTERRALGSPRSAAHDASGLRTARCTSPLSRYLFLHGL